MQEVVSQAAGITIELDVEQLGRVVGKHAAAELASLFPSDAAEFWSVLCEQACRERQRVAAMVGLTCPHRDDCPHKTDILAGISVGAQPSGSAAGSGERRGGAR